MKQHLYPALLSIVSVVSIGSTAWLSNNVVSLIEVTSSMLATQSSIVSNLNRVSKYIEIVDGRVDNIKDFVLLHPTKGHEDAIILENLSPLIVDIREIKRILDDTD